MNLATLWLVVLVTCLVWYSTITVYVAIRGIWDIRNMLARLRALRYAPPEQESAERREALWACEPEAMIEGRLFSRRRTRLSP